MANTLPGARGRESPWKPRTAAIPSWPDQIGVFAVRFLDSAPARVAADVDYRGEGQLRATRPHLARGYRENASQQVRVPGTGERYRLWEARGVAGYVAVQAFLVEEDGNAQARVLHRVVLNRIHERYGLASVSERMLVGAAAAANVTGAGDLADAGREDLFGFGGVEVAGGSQDLLLAIPDAGDLGDLLFQRHAGEEILHALVHGGVGIFVERLVVGGACDRCATQ